ncbi:MAG: cupin domain-containing protein [Chloroflexota bacterium]
MNANMDWAGNEYRDLISTQSYDAQPPIDGVRIDDLRVFSDEGGDFCEIARFGAAALEGWEGYQPEQLSWSWMQPGSIKAWHLHRLQDDLWFVPPRNRLLIGLLDVREDSETYRRRMRFTLGAGTAGLLRIPRGVAHGVANPGTDGASLLYFANHSFNREQPDEHRLPWDLLGKEFWSIVPG